MTNHVTVYAENYFILNESFKCEREPEISYSTHRNLNNFTVFLKNNLIIFKTSRVSYLAIILKNLNSLVHQT